MSQGKNTLKLLVKVKKYVVSIQWEILDNLTRVLLGTWFLCYIADMSKGHLKFNYHSIFNWSYTISTVMGRCMNIMYIKYVHGWLYIHVSVFTSKTMFHSKYMTQLLALDFQLWHQRHE